MLNQLVVVSSLDVLVPEMQDKMGQLIDDCWDKHSIELHIGTTLRGPIEQAKLFCYSRTVQHISAVREVLMASAPRIAGLLLDEYCGLGPQMTVHIPGQSWHQWREAADVAAVVGGKLVWDGHLAKTIATRAESLGLYHSFNMRGWEMLSRHWHVQLRPVETPLLIRDFAASWSVVEERMQQEFGPF